MHCKNPARRFGMWAAIAIAITAASMSSSKPHKADRPTASAADHAPARITLTFPLN